MKTIDYDLPIFEDSDKADLNLYSEKMAEAVKKQITKQDTEIANINEKDLNQDTGIEVLTQRLNEKDNQIAELKDKVSDLNNNQIHGKASGEYVHLSDSAKMECRIGILGNSRQETREGYNLIDFNNPTSLSYYTSKTFEKDTLTISCTGGTWQYARYDIMNIFEKYAGQTMSFQVESYSSSNSEANSTVQLAYNDGKNNYIQLLSSNTFTIPSDVSNITKAEIGIYANNTGNALSNTFTVVKPMLILGTAKKTYEQYGVMPSLDYPSEIETVGDNVNLLQNFATSQTIDGVTFTVNKDGTVIANGTAPTSKNVTFVINNKQLSLPAGKYALSGCPSNYVKKRICRIDIWRSDWSYLCSEQGDGGRMTLSEDIENLIVGVTIFKGETANNLVFKPKIEKGTVATEYSLYGIGSENVKVYNRNLLNTPYNSENKLTDTATSDGYYITTGFKAYLIAGKTYRFKCESNLKFGFASSGGEGLCYLMLNKQSNTFFQLLSNDRTITVKESGWYYLRYDIYKANKTASFWNFQIEEDTTSTDYIAHEEQNYHIDIQEEMLEGDYFDLENGKEVHNWQKIESYNGEEITTEYKSTTGELTTGATVYYKLAEPRKLDLTENQTQQLQALQKAKTYKNITNITTDTIAVLDVDYKRDLETYQKQQDDRITAIEQLLSATATSAMLLDNVQSDLESEVQ